jgi:S1-C subfamily serine protease
MNRILFLIVLILCTALLFGDNEDFAQKIFATYENSVVYIENSVFLDSSLVPDKTIFHKVESNLKTKILDDYFPCSTGSGFFITNDGYIITNNHVIEFNNIKKTRDNMYWNAMEMLSKKLPDKVITGTEFRVLMAQFRLLFDKAKFHNRLKVKNSKYYEYKILFADKKVDLALLKIEDPDESYEPILIGNSESLKVGDSVVSVGYPLSDIISQLVKDFKGTLTVGEVSALRTDNLGIQHTAAINPGNSGGPLFDKNGALVGINAAYLPDAKEIFFAIRSGTLKKWLSENKFDTIVEQNRNEAHLPSTDIAISQPIQTGGFIELGRSFFINLKEPCTVYIENVQKGKTPILLKDLLPGKGTLKIESDNSYYEQKIEISDKVQDIITLTPKIGKQVGNLDIVSNPVDAEILVDGKDMGKTPSKLANIVVGLHKIDLKLPGYTFKGKEIEIRKKETIRLNENLEKLFKVTFGKVLPAGTVITVKNELSNLQFVEKDEILLPVGKWTFGIESQIFEPLTFPVEIVNSDVNVPVDFHYYKAVLIFRDLMPESKIYLNNIDMTASVVQNKLEIAAGDYELLMTTSTYSDYKLSFSVYKNEDRWIANPYQHSSNYYFVSNSIIGYPTLIAGAIVCGLGFFLNSDEFLIPNTSSYGEYTTFKWVTFSAFCAGGITALIGGGFVVASIFNATDEAAQKKIQLSFDFDPSLKNVVLCVNLKM